MEQPSKATDDTRQGMNYSDEMLSLMRSMHAMMKAREEREATMMRSSPDSIHRASTIPVVANPTANKGESQANQNASEISAPTSAPFHPSSRFMPSSPETIIASKEAGTDPAQIPNSPVSASARELNPQAGTLTSTLHSLHEAVSNLKDTVDVSQEGIQQTGPDSTKPLKARTGLKKSQGKRVDAGAANYDYRLKYPEDERYHELDAEARVWWVYVDEATAFDNDVIKEMGASLDILLVFAGLFSTVLTTFAVETSKSLSRDPNRSAPTTVDFWVNGLWFTSLTIALSVALFAVLAKQWLRQYMSNVTGTPRERAFIRQFRFDGLEKWHVRLLIGMLPILVHLALILFLAGLVIFLVPLSIPMASVIGAFSLSVVVLYFMATILPLFTIQCSYRTAFTDMIYLPYQLSRGIFQRHLYPMIMSANNWTQKQVLHLSPPDWEHFREEDYPQTLKGAERYAACQPLFSNEGLEDLELNALKWLGESTSSPSAKDVLFLSLGAFTPKMSEKLVDTRSVLFGGSGILDVLINRVQVSHNLDELENAFRAAIHLNSKSWYDDHVHFQWLQLFYQMAPSYKACNCDITSAFTALAYGLSPVKFIHAGRCIELSAENAMDWILDTYQQEGSDLPPCALPKLVWKPLFQKSGYDTQILESYRLYLTSYTIPIDKLIEIGMHRRSTA